MTAGVVTGGAGKVKQEVQEAVSGAGEAVNKMADEFSERIEAAADAVAAKIVNKGAAPAEDGEAPTEEAPAEDAEGE